MLWNAFSFFIFFQMPVSPWQGGFPAGGSQGPSNPLNLLGSLMSSGSGNVANLASSLVAQALQNKPGGMIIGGNHFGPPMAGGPNRGGFMDRGGRGDDFRNVSLAG